MRYPASEDLAKAIRIDVLKMICKGRSSHIAAVFSMADILAVLYHDILRYHAQNPEWSDRDRVILSKGHAGAGIYAVLAECGFFPVDDLWKHCADGSLFSGHVSHQGVLGVELSTGSLGHGLPVGAGMAYALKDNGNTAKVYVILGDGECNEGTTWETALFAAQHKLNNLTVIIDRNRMQGLGDTEEILALEPFTDKWKAFNWNVSRVNGHDHTALRNALAETPDMPHCIIADTVKGKGVSFMEGNLKWHYSPPDDLEFQHAMQELQEGEK